MKVGEHQSSIMISKVTDAKPIHEDLGILIYRNIQKYLKTVSDKMDNHNTLNVEFSINISEPDDE